MLHKEGKIGAIHHAPHSREAAPRESKQTGVYTPTHLAELGFDYLRDVGLPGEFPFTRGIYPSMYQGRLWTMRQYAGFGSAGETNRRFRYMLERGLAGINVAFDLPTQHGYDSDHPLARGEVGKVGVPINSLRDMSCVGMVCHHWPTRCACSRSKRRGHLPRSGCASWPDGRSSSSRNGGCPRWMRSTRSHRTPRSLCSTCTIARF